MTRPEIDVLLRTILTDELKIDADPATITDSTRLEELELDSLDIVEIAQAFEDKAGVAVRGEDARSLYTVGDVVDLLERLAGEQLAPVS